MDLQSVEGAVETPSSVRVLEEHFIEHPDNIASGNPTHVWIEPTNRCNTRCTHCGHFYHHFGEDMPEELYERIARAVLDGVERVELLGYGEPFMAKNFERMFDECAARGIKIFTTSNGILLRNDERVAKIVRHDVLLNLSIDGARKETYEFVRPYIKWEKLIETLECLKRNADAAGSEKRYTLRFNYCAMKHSIGDLPDLVRLAHRYGATTIFVLPLGREELFEKVAGQSLHDSPEMVAGPYAEALELAAKYQIQLSVPESFVNLILEEAKAQGGAVRQLAEKARLAARYYKMHGTRKTFTKAMATARLGSKKRHAAGVTTCGIPWNDSYFASQGVVYACCAMSDPLGNMAEQQWEEIWNGAAYRNLRRTVNSWNPTKVCRFCALPMGINGGDDKHYQKRFSPYRRETIPLDSSRVEFNEGFYDCEMGEDGQPHHRWMGRVGQFSIKVEKDAKFLRLRLIALAPGDASNPGICRIDGGDLEPFDNSCDDVHFPIDFIRDGVVNVRLEMEKLYRVDPDPRDLALAICGVEVLYGN